MVWVFAVLVVLALGVIAVVAAGRGTPLEEAYDDRPDAVVPASGPLSGDDLRRVRFSLALRGYRMSEVDALLDRLAREREAEQAERDQQDQRDRQDQHDGHPDDTPPPRAGGRGDTESH